jgi:hypothetical protein
MPASYQQDELLRAKATDILTAAASDETAQPWLSHSSSGKSQPWKQHWPLGEDVRSAETGTTHGFGKGEMVMLDGRAN